MFIKSILSVLKKLLLVIFCIPQSKFTLHIFKRFLITCCLCQMLCVSLVNGQRIMEKLGRGVVATRTSATKILVSWRLLGTEPQDIGFNVYRSANGGTAVKLNGAVLTKGTNYEDFSPNLAVPNTYFVKPVVAGLEKEASAGYTLIANAEAKPFYKIKINKTPNYRIVYAFVGDFDGDGEYDYVMHKIPISDPGSIYPDLVEAYKRDGSYLWTINMGPNSTNRYNITPGSSSLDGGHGDNWTVYDINNDGKAEVILRTANGVKFPDSTVLVDANNGKQYISVIDGMTGHELSRTLVNNPYLSAGDDYGQLNGHMGIAYLDGIRPSLVWMPANRNADDSFNELIFTWDWNGYTPVPRWTFDLAGKHLASGHQIKIFDIDGDGKDEIIPQAFAVDDDGKLMYNLRDQAIDHGDRFSISDLDPKRPGLEIYGIQQGYSNLGIQWYYCDVKTGKLLLSQSNPGNYDMGRGMTADFDPDYLGQELYTFVGSLYSVNGSPTSTAVPNSYPNQRMYWDGDLGGELLDGGKIVKWDYINNYESRLYTATSTTGNGANATLWETTPAFYGDIIGDWREEAVYESSDHEYLIILETPHPTTERIYTLPHNPGYRSDMCVKGYYQSNNPDYYLGFDMQAPPVPGIQSANEYWHGNTAVWDNASNNWKDGITSAAKAFANGDTIMFDIRGINADTIKLNSTVAPGKVWIINPEGKDYAIIGTGKITGTGEVWKTMGGAFTLAGNHDYTGATIITDGQINIDGSLQSPVTVKGLGAVGGRGTLAGGLTLHKGVNVKGGRVSPGLGNTHEKLGTLTIPGNLDVPGDNNFEFDVVPGSTKVNDSIVVTGDLTVAGTNKLIVNFVNNNFVPGTYTLMKCGGTLSASLSNFTVVGVTGVSKQLVIQGNEVKLVINGSRRPQNVVWSGAVNTSWDFAHQNFKTGSTPTAFVSGDTLTFDSTAVQRTVVLNETVYPATITFNSDSSYTVQGTDSIGGLTGITKNGLSNLAILSTGNTYRGKTIVNGGTLTVARIGLQHEPSSMGAADSAAFNIQISNAALVVNEKSITDRAFTIAGTSTFNIPGADNYLILNADVTGQGKLVKDGPGSVYLIGKKNFSGPVVIRSGIINLRTIEGNNYGLGTSNNITIEDGTLGLDDLGVYSAPAWNLTVPAGKNATLVAHGRSNMTGTLSGSGTLNIRTPYIRTSYSGNWSAFTGKIVLYENEFRIANTAGYANSSISLTGGVIRAIAGAGSIIPIGELSGAAGTSLSSDNSTANWTIGAKNTDAGFAGNISRSALTKIGTGTFTVTGNNTYAGATTVNGGKLLVNNAAGTRGTGTGPVTVASGAILGGTGFIKGAISVNTGGMLQPGSNGTGTLTDSTSVMLATGTVTEMEVNKTASAFDILKVTGNIQFNGKLVVNKMDDADFVAGDNFKLFDATSYSGTFSSIEPAVPKAGLLWDVSQLSTTGTLRIKLDTGDAITYYWRGGAGNAASPTSWTSPANWNTAADGSGTVRTTPATNDMLIFDGSAMGPSDYFVGPVPEETAGSLLILNSAKVVFVSTGNNISADNFSVNSGRLLVNHTAGTQGIGTGAVTVASGATLGGTGFVNSNIAVSGGGKIQPGSDGIGTFSNGSRINFAAGAIAEMEINKTTGTFDILKTTGTIQYNGQLVITNVGAGNFVNGDNFKLFDASVYSGAFSSVSPASPGPGLIWNLSELATTGTLKVAIDPHAKVYYWRGAAGSAASPASWAVTTNWNTAANGTGTARTTPLPNDVLIFDGTNLGTSDRYVGAISTETTGALKIVNGAKITLVSTVYPASAISDAFTTSTFGGCTYAVTGTTGSFTNLKPGDVITTASSVVNPMPYAQVLAVKDGTHMTVSKESSFPTNAQTQYFLAPTLYTDTLTIDAASTLNFGAGTGGFSSLVLNTKGGTVAGKVNFGSRGGHHKLVCVTPNAGSSNLGLHFTGGSAVTISTSTTSKWNYNMGNTLGLYNNSTFIYNDGNGANNLTPGYSGDAGIVFEAGSTFTMGAGEHYTPLGAGYAASNPLTYTPAVAFNAGSRYVTTSAFVNAPQFISNNVDVSYADIEFQAGFSTNLNLGKVGNLTVSGTSGAAVNTGTLIVTGDIVNSTANAINFGNVIMGGTTNQTISGTGAVLFAALNIADKAEVTLFKNITAHDVHLLGKLSFGINTITGTGTFSTYATYSKTATSSFVLGSSDINGINNAGAGTLTYDYPIGASITHAACIPAGTIYRSFSGGANGQMSSYATVTAGGQTPTFSVTGSAYTTSSGSLMAATPGFNYLLGINAATLPVTLLFFTAQEQGGSVALKWETQTEINNDYFVIERSPDGISFQAIAKVKGAGTSYQNLKYSFIDNTPNAGNNYYRIRQMNFDGQSSFSKLEQVNVASSVSLFVVYPNPTNSYIQLGVRSAHSVFNLQIRSLDGRLLFSDKGSLEKLNERLKIRSLHFASGTYVVKLGNGSDVWVRQYIKQL